MNFCGTHGVIEWEMFLVVCVFEVIHFAVASVQDQTDALCCHFVKNLHLSLVWATQLIDSIYCIYGSVFIGMYCVLAVINAYFLCNMIAM